MSDQQKKIGIIAFVVVLLGIIIWWEMRPSPEEARQSADSYWICQEKSCGNTFSMSQSQLAAHYDKHYGEPVPCPKCGKANTVRAIKCPSCGTVSAQERGQTKCPKCGKDLYP